MTFQYASDLHLEFPDNRAWLEEHPLEHCADVLLLAGDVLPFSASAQYRKLLLRLVKPFREVLWLPGNHEYYGGALDDAAGLDGGLRPNVRLVQDRVLHYPGTRLLCTTLWSPISQLNEGMMRRQVSDYEAIRFGRGLLLPAHVTRRHEQCLAWLKAELEKPFDGATVVMTHHVPTLAHYPAEFAGSPLNEAFAVELGALIEGSTVAAWVHGHHHRNTPEFSVGRTRLLTNQLGYVAQGEQRGFRTDALLHLPS